MNEQTRNETIEQVRRFINDVQWGSVEIYIQDGKVVQVTKRHIKKIKESE